MQFLDAFIQKMYIALYMYITFYEFMHCLKIKPWDRTLVFCYPVLFLFILIIEISLIFNILSFIVKCRCSLHSLHSGY